MNTGLPSSPGIADMSIRWIGVSLRCLANSGYGSRTLPETTSSNAPKSSRSSNRSDMLLLSNGRVGHGFHFGVLVETGDAVLASDPAGLISAERCVGAVARGAVDADEAGTQPLGHRQSAIECSGHDVACQPIRTVIGDPHRVVFVVERNDDEHRPEDLFLSDGHRVVDVDEKRWLDKEPLVQPVGRLGAADKHPCTLFDAFFDIAPDSAALPIGDDRAAQRRSVLRVSRRYTLIDSLEDLDALVVTRSRQQHSSRH